jgi:hypothetical protein
MAYNTACTWPADFCGIFGLFLRSSDTFRQPHKGELMASEESHERGERL